jgi:hypothetical protein
LRQSCTPACTISLHDIRHRVGTKCRRFHLARKSPCDPYHQGRTRPAAVGATGAAGRWRKVRSRRGPNWRDRTQHGSASTLLVTQMRAQHCAAAVPLGPSWDRCVFDSSCRPDRRATVGE